MKIFNNEELIADCDIQLNFLETRKDLSSVECELLQYSYQPFISSIVSLIDDVVVSHKVLWTIPDYQKTKVYFYVTLEEASLALEVFPKKFSQAEKTIMLERSSKEIRFDGYSDYLEMLDILDDIDTFAANGIGCINTYKLSLTEKESKFIYNY